MSDDSNTGATESATPAPAASATSVDEALEQSYASEMTARAAPDAPDPAVTDGDPPTTEAAPQETDAPVVLPDGKEGPIPFTVHKTALDNARLKAAQETETRLTQQWQQDVQPVLSAAKAIAQDVTTGSIDGLRQLLNEYAAHPQLGPQLQSMLASQQRPAAPPQTDDQEPQPDYDYNGTPFFSAPQLQKWQQWHARQTDARIQQQLQPLQQSHQQTQLKQKVDEMRHTALSNAQAQYAELAADPDFVEHQALVSERMQTHGWGVERAWQQVYKDVVVPKKVGQQQSQWVRQAVKQSTGSTVDPAANAPAQPWRPKKGMSIDDVLDHSFAPQEHR